mgnify:CR=1 FL=1
MLQLPIAISVVTSLYFSMIRYVTHCKWRWSRGLVIKSTLTEEHIHHYWVYWCIHKQFYVMNFKLFRSRFTHPMLRYPASLTLFTIFLALSVGIVSGIMFLVSKFYTESSKKVARCSAVWLSVVWLVSRITIDMLKDSLLMECAVTAV